MKRFKKNELLILLGAGASHDAGVPTSMGMINKIENCLQDEWTEYRDLYNFLKSSIFYAEGIKGNFSQEDDYDIERLINTVSQLTQKVEHPLFPFIGNWNMKLKELAGSQLEKVSEFKQKILEKLQSDWVSIPNYRTANYFENLVDLKEQYEYPLRIFTLNYDLCIEKSCSGDNYQVLRGFNDDRNWNWQFMEDPPYSPDIYLYKLHGSIDWFYNENGNLTYTDSPHTLDTEDLAIIFGTNQKLQYEDPFLFLTYQLRKWTISEESRLILCVGYGFRDDHINKIIGQALKSSTEKILLSISLIDEDENDERKRIHQQLELENNDQIEVIDCSTEEYFNKTLSLEELGEYLPSENDPF